MFLNTSLKNHITDGIIITAVNTVYKNKETLKECFEKLQSMRKEATVRAATGMLCMMTDKGLNFRLTFFHCIMPHLYTLYNQLQCSNANSTSTYNAGMNFLSDHHRHKQSSLSHSQMGKFSSNEKERNYTKPYLWKTGVHYYNSSGEREVCFQP